MKEIEDWRSQIDAIDAELLRLLSRRARLAVEIAASKRAAGLPLRSPAREAEIVARVCGSNGGPLDRRAVKRLFRQIISESRRAAGRARAAAKKGRR